VTHCSQHSKTHSLLSCIDLALAFETYAVSTNGVARSQTERVCAPVKQHMPTLRF